MFQNCGVKMSIFYLNKKNKMDSNKKRNPFVFIILLVLFSELFVYPFLAFLQYVLGYDINASYFLRFNYLIISFLGLLIIFIKLKTPNIFLIKVFFIFLILGLSKGVYNGNFFNYSDSGSNIFLSHFFYLLNPILSMTLGYYMYSLIFKKSYYYNLFSKLFKWSFIYGFILAVAFQIVYIGGGSYYDSLDLWNVFYGGGFMLSVSNSFIMPFYVILLSILLAKRVTILVAFTMVIIYFLRTTFKKILYYLIPIALVIVLFQNFNFDNLSGIKRLTTTVELAQANDIEVASAGRLIEALSALEIITSNASDFLIGTGFGSYFYPWPEIDPNYKSHYTHFTPVSYMWIGGIILTLLVYWSLIRLTISLFKIKKLKNLTQTSLFQFMLPAIIISSITGAVLMNNSILWMIIGMIYKLIEEEKLSRKLAIQ